MAQAPLREHYSSDEEYFRELDIFNTQVESDLASAASGTGVSVVRDDQDRPVIGGIVQSYQQRYLLTRYATSADGSVGFTADYNTIVGLTVYQGVRESATPNESTNPADYTWRELNVAAGWTPSFRVLGGRQIDWMVGSSVPSGYIEDTAATVVDLDSLPGAVGADGNSIGTVVAFIRSTNDITSTTPAATTYNTANSDFDAPTGYSKAIPQTPPGVDIYATYATVFGSGTVALAWGSPSLYGRAGDSITITNTETLDNGDIQLTFSDTTMVEIPKGNTVARFEVFIESANLPSSITTGSYNVETNVLTPPTGWSQDIPDGNINVWRAVGTIDTNATAGSVTVTFTINSTVAYANGLNGIDGNTSFQDIAFASNDDGTSGFSLTPSDALRYEGVYTYSASTRQDPQSTTPTDYVWREIRAADSEVAAIQALVSYSNGLVFVRAPNNGDYTPAPVSNEITSRVDVVFQSAEGTAVLARVSRNVVYNTTTQTFTQATVAHPSGDLNASRVTITPTITTNSVEFSFVYAHDGRQANTEAEVFLVQGGGVGPANLRRFRTASDAGAAGRPTTDSGLDNNWVDNPDLLSAGTLFESAQQVNVTQDGRPYSTDLVFSGTSGGAYQPAQPEIQTITVDANAQTSTNNPGSAEIIRFTPSGDPGTQTLAQATLSLANLPATILWSDIDLDEQSITRIVLDFNLERESLSGISQTPIRVETDSASDTLDEYIAANQIDTNSGSLDVIGFVTWVFNNLEITGVGATYQVTSTADSVTVTFTQTSETEDLVWTAFDDNVASRIIILLKTGVTDPFPGGADSHTSSSSGEFYTRDAAGAVVTGGSRGAQTSGTIPYVDSNGSQQTYSFPTVVYQTADTTSALQSIRFRNAFEYQTLISGIEGVTFTGFDYSPSNTSLLNFDWTFSTTSTAASSYTPSAWPTSGFIIIDLFIGQVVESGLDTLEITTTTGTATYTFTGSISSGAEGALTIVSLDTSTGVPPGGTTANDTLSFSSTANPAIYETHYGLANGFSVVVDGDDVLITGENIGDVTSSVVLTTTQNTGNIMYTTPAVTEGANPDNASDVTFRVPTNDSGSTQDITVMFTSQLNAAGIASALVGTAYPNWTDAIDGSNNRVVRLTSSVDEPRGQITIVNVDAGTNGNITSGSFTIATEQDGVEANTVVTGTRSTLSVVTSAGSDSIIIPPNTNLTFYDDNIETLIDWDNLEMYVDSGSGGRLSAESYSRALGGDFNFTATFTPGDSSTASMVQENEVAGINEVHDGTQVRWSRAIQVGTIS